MTRTRRLLRTAVVTAMLISSVLSTAGCSMSAQRKQDGEFLRRVVVADRNYQRGELDQARQEYEQVLAAKPDYVAAHTRLGAIAYKQGDNETAAEQFQKVLAKDQRNAQARYNLALVRLDDARQLLRQYLELQPGASESERIRALMSQLEQFGGK
jgi:tetratricopeptide (TPR) repeat protein